ncbi:MAG: hypothetical protein PVH21_18445 [Myxococcales bacterium]|jgi:hypothetical protein
MRRFILLALMVVTVAGCDRFPDLSIQVTANLKPTTNNCTVTADQEQLVSIGRYDRNYGGSYRIIPRIESYLVNNGLEFQGSQGNVQIESFELTILLPDGTQPDFGDLPNPYTQGASSAVIPASTSPGTPSLGFATAIGIPENYIGPVVDALDSTGFDSIVLEIRANGKTAGGFSNQSPPFSWPVTFCSGCLGTTCEEPAMVGDPTDGSCLPGQDSWQYCAEITPAATP